MPPVKILLYGFLRRHYPHQVKGSKLITSSQPANTSSPVFICLLLYIIFCKNAIRNLLFHKIFVEFVNVIICLNLYGGIKNWRILFIGQMLSKFVFLYFKMIFLLRIRFRSIEKFRSERYRVP